MANSPEKDVPYPTPVSWHEDDDGDDGSENSVDMDANDLDTTLKALPADVLDKEMIRSLKEGENKEEVWNGFWKDSDNSNVSDEIASAITAPELDVGSDDNGQILLDALSGGGEHSYRT